MGKKIKILGFGGSLRKGSFNEALLQSGALLNEACDLCPTEGKIEVFDRIGEFPLYNQDQEVEIPDIVKEFKDKIKQADAIFIVTPEYNFSMPGYLKNAIDWASRPYGDNSFDDKPAAIMSASPGMLGGVRAQYALRQTCVFLNLHLLNKPEVIIPQVHEKIKDGKLVDEYTKEKIRELLIALCVWTRRLAPANMADAKITINHDEIQEWAEKYGGKPQIIDDPSAFADIPGIRIDFPGKIDDLFLSKGDIGNISWEKFFKKFEELSLAFIYVSDFDPNDPVDIYKSYRFIKRDALSRKADEDEVMYKILKEFKDEFITQNPKTSENAKVSERISLRELSEKEEPYDIQELEKNHPHEVGEQSASGSMPNPELVTSKTTLERVKKIK